MAKSNKQLDIGCFLTDFNTKRATLTAKLETIQAAGDVVDRSSVQDEMDTVIKEYNQMKKLFNDASSYLPAYNSKSAQNSLNDVWAAIEAKKVLVLPRKKFAFGKQAAKPKVEIAKQVPDEPDKVPAIYPEAEFHGLRDMADADLNIPKEEADGRDLQINNLTRCTVSLMGSPNNVFIKELKDCTVNLGPTRTSIFVSDCIRCTFKAASQQLRIHSTTLTNFFVLTTSKPIIEDCSKLQFGKYNFEYEGIEGDFEKAGIHKDTSFFDQVIDFNWLGTTPSPNWIVNLSN